MVLTISMIFHIFHASFFLDFWSIWPDRADLEDAWKRIQRFMGKTAPPPRKFAKYPLENKLYHGAIILAGLSVILTGVFMMFRVRTIFFSRQSLSVWRYDLGADVRAARVGRRRTDRAGDRSRLLRGPPGEVGYYRVDDRRFDEPGLLLEGARSATLGGRRHDVIIRRTAGLRMPPEFAERCDTIEECYEFMLAYAGQGLPSDAGSQAGGQIRGFLQRAIDALTGLAESCAQAGPRPALNPPRSICLSLRYLQHDAQDSLAALELVLAQPAISSQLIDNLNASIHLRALLTDLFLIGEVLSVQTKKTQS